MATGGGFTRSIDKSCDMFNDYSCTPCSSSGINVDAITLCVDCDEYFCQKCLEHHNKFGKMKLHQILDKAKMKTRPRPRQVSSLPTERCQLHHGNILDTFCVVHDAVCCGTCVTLEHRICQGMTYLPTAAKGVKSSKEYRDIKISMQSFKHQLSKAKTARKNQLNTLEMEKNDVLTQLKDFRKRMMTRLDELETNTTKELCVKHQILQDQLNTDIKILEEMLETMETNMKNLEISTGNNESQLFVYVKAGKKNEECSRKLLREIESRRKRRALKFDVNPNIEEIMNAQESLVDFQLDEQLYSAALQGNYSVKVKGDTIQCDIVGSCLLEDGTLLITDRNNKKLKRLQEMSYRVRDYCDMPGCPFAVCATGPQEVAVTLTNDKTIQFVSVRDKMTLTGSFKTRGNCRGLAYTNGQLIIAGDDVLNVYNKTGTLLKTINHGSLTQALLFMLSPVNHIALSNDHSKIHITRAYAALITLGIHGDTKSQFTDPELRYASGVCVGNNDEIFVCCRKSHNIFQIGRDGRKLCVVLEESEGIKQPQSLCWDRANSRLILTMYNTDNIKVFDMK